MWNHYQNMHPIFFPKDHSEREDRVRTFFQKQDQWTQQMIEQNPGDKYWRHVSYIVSQLNGLNDGYLSVAKQHKDWVSTGKLSQ